MKLKTIVGLGAVLVLLVGCSKEPKEVKEELQSIQSDPVSVLDLYETDKLEPYLYEEKSEEDIRREVAEQMLGIQSKHTPLLATGVKKKQGLIIEAGIYTGRSIPTTTKLPSRADFKEKDELRWEQLSNKSMREFSNLMVQTNNLIQSNKQIDQSELLRQQIEKRKDMIGKPKDFHDLDIWNFDAKIEQRYKEELTAIRNDIQKKREIEKARETVRLIQEEVLSMEEQQKLEEQEEELNERHQEILTSLVNREERFRKKLDEDKDLTDDERNGITQEEKELEEENESEKDTEDGEDE